MELEDLGFNNWFRKKAEELQLRDADAARVVAVNKNNYTIRNRSAEIIAEIAGKIMYGADSALDYPTVGDWVGVQYYDGATLAIIHQILPRQSLLKRKVAGKRIDYQLIAANIDTAFLVQSLDRNFNLRRLERYLTMTNDSNIEPVILLSKSDLVEPGKLRESVSLASSVSRDYEIIAFSSTTGDGLDQIRAVITGGRTYCLLGSSGVGKTTLLNKLIGDDVFDTAEVREKDGKGRHKTSRRQLTILGPGGMIVDTPGMRELGSMGSEVGLGETFADIVELAAACRFADCTHVNEPGCAVLKAVKDGELSEARYRNYLKIRKESEYHEMSYLDKRKKDKKFGKMVKGVLKDIKKRKR